MNILEKEMDLALRIIMLMNLMTIIEYALEVYKDKEHLE